MDFGNFIGAAKRLDDIDIPRIAAIIGVGEDELHAFMDVESLGSGFDRHGRPKLLFEPHVFYRNLKGPLRSKAVSLGLAYAKWGSQPYPKDSYPRLMEAMKINQEAALKACSWGSTQVLGENFALAGFDTVFEMVDAFMQDEENHIKAATRFIEASGIDDDLRALAKLKRPTTPEDCVPIVLVYNGKGYAKNKYHIKFAAAHNKWRKIPDTPFVGITVPDDFDVSSLEHYDSNAMLIPVPAPSPERELKVEPHQSRVNLKDGQKHKQLESIQDKLDALGYPEVGTIDGKWGTRTRAAVMAFRADNGLPLVADIDDAFLAALMTAEPRDMGERSQVTIADLRADGAEEIKAADKTQMVGYASVGTGALAAANKVMDDAEQYSDLASRVSAITDPIQSFVGDNFWLLAIGLGAFFVWQSGVLKNLRLAKHRTGQDVSR